MNDQPIPYTLGRRAMNYELPADMPPDPFEPDEPATRWGTEQSGITWGFKSELLDGIWYTTVEFVFPGNMPNLGVRVQPEDGDMIVTLFAEQNRLTRARRDAD